jgi:hypothetical protein
LDQTNLVAAPAATDIRFKLATFLLLGGWLTTVYSLQHSIYHYISYENGIRNRFIAFLRYTPTKFVLTLFLSLVMIGYAAAIAFYFPISPLKLHTKLEFVYPLGWGPIALILFVYEVAGYVDPNEDRELLRQRRIRDVAADEEMGYTRKPRWWSILHGENRNVGVQERITTNVAEIGGGNPAARGLDRGMEMDDLPSPTRYGRNMEHPTEDTEALRTAESVQFSPRMNTERIFRDNPTRSGDSEASSMTRVESERGESTNSTIFLSSPPQQVRSMLDV